MFKGLPCLPAFALSCVDIEGGPDRLCDMVYSNNEWSCILAFESLFAVVFVRAENMAFRTFSLCEVFTEALHAARICSISLINSRTWFSNFKYELGFHQCHFRRNRYFFSALITIILALCSTLPLFFFKLIKLMLVVLLSGQG